MFQSTAPRGGRLEVAPYRTLKDPLRRTEYLIKLAGGEIGASADASPVQNKKNVPADLLEEVFDLNMQLEELRAAKKTGREDPQLKETLQKAKDKFKGKVNVVDRDLRNQWAIWDAGDAAARQPAQRAMVALLDRRRFLSNLVRDLNEILGD